MSTDAFAFVAQAADQAITRWGIPDAVRGGSIARLVGEGAAYWRQGLPDGSHLNLIRLFSPVVRREEVFLGNVLLNDFLSKTLMRAAEQDNSGRIALLANDPESYYYLYHGRATLDEMAERFRQALLTSLPDLYFGDDNSAQGVYGNVSRMLTFYKSNIEPFPAFAVPQELLPGLLGKVNESLRKLTGDQATNINIILAVLSFFYAKDGAEMQSFYALLSRVMSEGWLPIDKMRAVLALAPSEDFDKDTFSERKKGQVIDRVQLEEAVELFLRNMEQQIRQGQSDMVAANLARKMLPLNVVQMVAALVRGVQLGFLPLGRLEEHSKIGAALPCRFCGTDASVIVEKNITGGFGAGRFHNQSPKTRPFEQALCGRCGISGYLEIKLLGMQIARPQPKAKDFPVPKQYNIIFHYGRHDEAQAKQIAGIIDDLFDLISSCWQRAQEEKRFFSVEYIRDEISRRAREREAQDSVRGERVPSVEEAIAALIADDAVASGLEILGQMRQDLQAQVLPLGVGDYRLLAFILPQLRPGRDEALDFVQRRFSRSRLITFTLLALLRKLCGCDGPYYFQSVPTLAPGGFDSNTFYVQGKGENADNAIRRYSAIVNFARRVAKYRDGHSLLADWILLAERLEEDPLGVFSEVLRGSPLRVGDDLQDAQYKRLSDEFIRGTRMVDGTEYLKLIEQLKQL